MAKKFWTLLFLLILMAWTSKVLAYPICNQSFYSFDVAFYNGGIHGGDYIVRENPEPGVYSEYYHLSAVEAWATANVAEDSNDILVEFRVNEEANDTNVGEGISELTMKLNNCQATFPAINIKYDYGLETTIDFPPLVGNYGYSFARVFSRVFDLTDNVTLWEDSYELEIGGAQSYYLSHYDTVDIIVPLTLGHEFELETLVFTNNYGDYVRAHGLAWMNNIEVNAVPLPSALLLLGSGLIGLTAVGWRRRKRG